MSCIAVFPIYMDEDSNSCLFGSLIVGEKASNDLFIIENSNRLIQIIN